MSNPEDAVIAEIDLLVDGQLAHEPSSRTHVDLQQPYCSCGQQWHGLASADCPGTPQVGVGESRDLRDGMTMLRSAFSVRSLDPLTLLSSQFFVDVTRRGRSHGPIRLLSIEEFERNGTATHVLGYLPCDGPEDQAYVYEQGRGRPICASGEHGYRLNKMSADGDTVEDSMPIPPEMAAQLLVNNCQTHRFLWASYPVQIPEILGYFRTHPIHPPGSSRKSRRDKARKRKRQQPMRLREGRIPPGLVKHPR